MSAVLMQERPLGPNWLPRPIVKPSPLAKDRVRLCGRCGERPIAQEKHFCDACEDHWDQIYHAGGRWDQVRRYYIQDIRELTGYRIRLIVARAKVERARAELEENVLRGEPGGYRDWLFDCYGREWAQLKALRAEIQEHKRKFSDRRQRVLPLP